MWKMLTKYKLLSACGIIKAEMFRLQEIEFYGESNDLCSVQVNGPPVNVFVY